MAQTNQQDLIKQLLALTSLRPTPEEKKILESVPEKGKVLNPREIILITLDKRRESKANELLRELLGL